MTRHKEPAELQEVIEVVTTAKLMTKVVTAAAPITTATIIAVPTAARRRKGVVIRDPEETTTPSTIDDKVVEKDANVQGTLVKSQAQIYKIDLEHADKLEEEEGRALKRKRESLEEKAAKKQKLDEDVEELKKHLQIMPNDDDDV
nr:hypothetical protein [Tanacetum cinerariifolium]